MQILNHSLKAEEMAQALKEKALEVALLEQEV